MEWVVENIGTLGVGLCVVAVVALAIFVLVKDRRSRGSCLGCACGHGDTNSGTCEPDDARICGHDDIDKCEFGDICKYGPGDDSTPCRL